MNARLNILYVLDSLCQASLKSGFQGYVDLVRPDLEKIIAAVVPNDARGMVNAASVRKVKFLALTKSAAIIVVRTVDLHAF